MNNITGIKNKITSIWNYTELEMSDFSKAGLQKHMIKISGLVNEVLKDLDGISTCSICNYEVCDNCSNEMEQEMHDTEY